MAGAHAASDYVPQKSPTLRCTQVGVLKLQFSRCTVSPASCCKPVLITSAVAAPTSCCMQCHCQLPTRHSLYGQKVFTSVSRRPSRHKPALIRAVAVTQIPTSLSTSRYVSTRFAQTGLRQLQGCLELAFHLLSYFECLHTSIPICCAPLCRVWEAAYEQLQMEKGVCNLIQKYSPEAVRERALSTPTASFQILVRLCSYCAPCCIQRALAARKADSELKPAALVGSWPEDDCCHGGIFFGAYMGPHHWTSRHSWTGTVPCGTAQVAQWPEWLLVWQLRLVRQTPI